MTVIKDFIDMMEIAIEDDKRDFKHNPTQFNKIYLSCREDITHSIEYIALKAQLEQKIVVTDEILCAAMDAHRKYLITNYTRLERLQGIDGFRAWRAALEAVFELVSMQYNSDKELSVQDNINKEEKPLNDGWIPNTSKRQPVGDAEMVEVKFRNGTFAICEACEWNWDAEGEGEIIAYRIMLEPEKECTCNANLYSGQLQHICQKCNKHKKPYLIKRAYNDEKLTFALISEYLEQRLK